MNVEELFGFLKEDYGLSYKHQEFTNCYNGNWIVQTYSFFNDSGCFTILFLPQRNEIEFFCSKEFSRKYEKLSENSVDICTIEPDIWDKHTKVFGIRRPFFWWSKHKVLQAFAEALKVHLIKEKSFFGIIV